MNPRRYDIYAVLSTQICGFYNVEDQSERICVTYSDGDRSDEIRVTSCDGDSSDQIRVGVIFAMRAMRTAACSFVAELAGKIRNELRSPRIRASGSASIRALADPGG